MFLKKKKIIPVFFSLVSRPCLEKMSSYGGAKQGGGGGSSSRRSSTARSQQQQSSPPVNFHSLTRLLSTDLRDLSPQSRKHAQSLRGLSRLVARNQTKKKLEYPFHLVIDGVVPLFVFRNTSGGSPQFSSDMYQLTHETTGHECREPDRIPPKYPYRIIREYGILSSYQKRTTLNWSGGVNGSHKQRYQRIFKNDDRDVEWSQLQKAQFRQIVGKMNQDISNVLLEFVIRHIDPKQVLNVALGMIRTGLPCDPQFINNVKGTGQQSLSSFGTNGVNNLYMMTGRLRLTVGFHTIDEVMRFLDDKKYDMLTFYSPYEASRVTISFRDKLDPRGDFVPLYEIRDRSWISSDFSLLLTSYIQRKESMSSRR